MARPLFDYSHLSTDERIELAEELWDSLAEAPDAVPLTAEQAEELDRRLESYQKDQNPGVPWAEALKKIEEPGG